MASAKFGIIHSATTAMRGNSEPAIYMAVAAQFELEIIHSSATAVRRDAMLAIQVSMTTQMEGRVVSSSSTATCKDIFEFRSIHAFMINSSFSCKQKYSKLFFGSQHRFYFTLKIIYLR